MVRKIRRMKSLIKKIARSNKCYVCEKRKWTTIIEFTSRIKKPTKVIKKVCDHCCDVYYKGNIVKEEKC